MTSDAPDTAWRLRPVYESAKVELAEAEARCSDGGPSSITRSLCEAMSAPIDEIIRTTGVDEVTRRACRCRELTSRVTPYSQALRQAMASGLPIDRPFWTLDNKDAPSLRVIATLFDELRDLTTHQELSTNQTNVADGLRRELQLVADQLTEEHAYGCSLLELCQKWCTFADEDGRADDWEAPGGYHPDDLHAMTQAVDAVYEWAMQQLAVIHGDANLAAPLPELIQDDLRILQYLAEQPGVAKDRVDIATAADLSERTVGNRLQHLRNTSVGYVKHPEGHKKRGNLITLAGILRLESMVPKNSP